MIVTLILDDDIEAECMALTISNVGEREYIALLSMGGADSEESEVYLYRYSETEDGIPNPDSIEDDNEYEIVVGAFDGLLGTWERDELVGEAEEEQSG